MKSTKDIEDFCAGGDVSEKVAGLVDTLSSPVFFAHKSAEVVAKEEANAKEIEEKAKKEKKENDDKAIAEAKALKDKASASNTQIGVFVAALPFFFLFY
jgi:seryl-tRNA synthetase